MKNILTFFSFLFILGTAHAQAPQGIPYQAAARNSSGAVLASTSISVRFTIRDSIATGIIKYRETHSTTTDANGMFSLTVGQGTPVSGTFASINWGTNAKFMQVELDPAGGNSYIDMGTQQMMSVPYALNAGAIKLTVSAIGDTLYSGGGNYVTIPGISAANCTVSAGTITGTATVCAGSSSTLSNASIGGTWNSSNTSIATVNSSGLVSGVTLGTATISYTVTESCGSATTTLVVTVNPLPSAGTITGSATVIVGSTIMLSNATTGGIWSSSNTSKATIGSTGVVSGVATGTATISYTVTSVCGSTVATKLVTVNAALAIGSSFGGGKIAYILQPGDPGYIAGENHGLIAAPSDQTSMLWGCNGVSVAGISTAFGTGAANTAILSAPCGGAAQLCYELVLSGYSDWYLPSLGELNKLYINRGSIGGFNTGFYWSSSELSAFNGYGIYFHSGYSDSQSKTIAYNVRAIRSF